MRAHIPIFYKNAAETTVRQRQKRERDRPVDVKRGGRPHRTKVVKEEDGVTPEEKPVVKRQRTLLSEFVTVDEKVLPQPPVLHPYLLLCSSPYSLLCFTQFSFILNADRGFRKQVPQ